jgi:hypothetical protein
MTGAERIAAERQRQIEVEGWTPEHDAAEVPTDAQGNKARVYVGHDDDLRSWRLQWCLDGRHSHFFGPKIATPREACDLADELNGESK